jgi:hypothetical protein
MGRTSNIAKLSMTDLQAEIRRRQRSVGPLMRRREALLKRLAEIDAELAALGGMIDGDNRGIPGRRRRAVNATPLPEALKAVLEGKTLSVTEAAEAVQAAGYKTHSSNFKIMVNMVLTKYPKMFKRVARGQYTAR